MNNTMTTEELDKIETEARAIYGYLAKGYSGCVREAVEEILASVAQARASMPADELPKAGVPMCDTCDNAAQPLPDGSYGACQDCLDDAEPVKSGASMPVQAAPSIKTWQERIAERHPTSEAQHWPVELKAKYMEAEIADRRAALAAKAQQAAPAAVEPNKHYYAIRRAANLLKARGFPELHDELKAILAAPTAAVVPSKGVTLKAFKGADTKEWHITIQHPFGTSWVKMSDPRDIKLAEMIAAAPIAPKAEDARDGASEQDAGATEAKLDNALWMLMQFPIGRYLMSCAHGRWDGHEKAQRHAELCKIFLAVEHGCIDLDEVRREHNCDYEAVHAETQKLTDHLDEVIGFPLDEEPNYAALEPMFFEWFVTHARAAMSSAPAVDTTDTKEKN